MQQIALQRSINAIDRVKRSYNCDSPAFGRG